MMANIVVSNGVFFMQALRIFTVTILLLGFLSVSPLPAGAADGPPPITFAAAVDRALQRNPTVAVALSEIARADALVRQARAGLIPSLYGNGTYTRLDSDRLPSADKGQLYGNLTLTVPLVAPLAWGQTWQARENRRVAEASAGDVRRQLATATARAYLAVVAQHRVVVVNETARVTAKQHYDYAHTRLLGGLGHSIDDVRAAQDLASVEVQVQAAYASLVRAREALGVLLAADGPIDTTDTVELAAPPPQDLALREANAQRADIKLLNQRLAAAQATADRTWTYYAPLLSAVGQPYLQKGSHVLDEKGWQAQLILTLPLYDGGFRSGVGREREVLVDEARANLESGLRQAQSDVRAAFETLLLADRGLAAARQATAFAQKAQQLATMAYQAGATTNLEVIDADRRARDAETAAVQAEDVSRQARLDLLLASGRFP
jgi:outer membrane protein TolC